MDEKRNAAPGSQPNTAQELRRALSQEVYVSFEIEGIDQVKMLIKQQKDLIFRLEQNVQQLDRAIIRLNARVSENPTSSGNANHEV